MPPLDWPLPSQFGQYELKIEVQPKAHHRAHYETEGSRGAVKAASGGHPIVKVTLFFSPHMLKNVLMSVVFKWCHKPHTFSLYLKM